MKKVFIILLVLLTLGCSSSQKDLEGKGENAHERCVEAFDGLKTNNLDELLLFSYPGLDANKRFFLGSEQGIRLRSYMTYKVANMKEIEDNSDFPTYELTVSIKSIDMQKVIEEYEKIAQLPLYKKTLLEAIDNSKDTKVKTTVQVKAVLYPEVDVWRIQLNDDVFNALFPNYDKYIEWLN